MTDARHRPINVSLRSRIAKGVTGVTVSPAPASVVAGGKMQFAASVQGTSTNKSVTWAASIGSISSSGLFTAPATVGSGRVTATSVADPTKSASAPVTVTSPAPPPTVTSVTVSPNATTVPTNGTVQFAASVMGTSTNKSVTWTAVLGAVTPAGAYTAPAKAGTDTVTATSNADPSKLGSASVTITAPTPPPPPTPSAACDSSGCPAFPGAQGGGATSVGGRGGQVFEVTNLSDSGSGSLRACIEASGPRTCVFRVAGMITQKSSLQVNNPYLTIAGQTSPGQIIIGGPGNVGFGLRISTHDVIVRYITFSPDDFNVKPGPSTGTLGFAVVNASAYNIINDHCTHRWSSNKMWIAESLYPGEYETNITTQWGLFYEPHEDHPVGVGTGNAQVSGTATNAANSGDNDFHHNLLVNVDHRIPEYDNGSLRWINNVTYNYSFFGMAAFGATQTDVINNVWDYSNLVASQVPVHSTDGNQAGFILGTPSFYVAGNMGPGQSAPNADQFGELARQIDTENGPEVGPFPSSWQRSSPLPPANAFAIQVDDAANLANILPPTVGNSQSLDCSGIFFLRRDDADTRIVSQWTSHGPGGFWPNGMTLTGQLTWPQPTAQWQDNPVLGGSACVESLHDGIPDQWKQLKGLSLTDPNLYKTIAPNGYTWLENYLNGQ